MPARGLHEPGTPGRQAGAERDLEGEKLMEPRHDSVQGPPVYYESLLIKGEGPSPASPFLVSGASLQVTCRIGCASGISQGPLSR